MAQPKEVAAQLRRFADELDGLSCDTAALSFVATLSKIKTYTTKSQPHVSRFFDELYFDEIRIAILSIALDVRLFEALAKDGNTGRAEVDLAETLHVDPALLHRMLRMFIATGDIIRIDGGRYKNSDYTNELGTTWLGEAARINLEVLGRVFNGFPDIIGERGYCEPVDAKATGSHAVFDGKSCFEHMYANPELLRKWNLAMANFGIIENMINQKWYDLWPIQERLIDGYDHTAGLLLVNVGGGNEKRAKAFLDSLPQPYPLVVQDLPQAITEAEKWREAPEHIELMAHDFFEKQPVVGARAYWQVQPICSSAALTNALQ